MKRILSFILLAILALPAACSRPIRSCPTLPPIETSTPTFTMPCGATCSVTATPTASLSTTPSRTATFTATSTTTLTHPCSMNPGTNGPMSIAGTLSAVPNRLYLQTVKMSNDGTIFRLSFYLYGGSGHFRVGLYDLAGTLLTQSVEVTGVPGWNHVDVPYVYRGLTTDRVGIISDQGFVLGLSQYDAGTYPAASVTQAYGELPTTVPGGTTVESPFGAYTSWCQYQNLNATSTPTRTATATLTAPCGATCSVTATPTSTVPVCNSPVTFGNLNHTSDTITSTWDGVATSFIAPAGGWVRVIWVWMSTTGTRVSAGLYTDAAGQPGTLLTTSESRVNVGTGGWVAFPVPPAAVSAAVTYWLTVHGEHMTPGYITPGQSVHFTSPVADPLPADYSDVFGSNLQSRTYAIFAQICSNGPVGSTPTPTFTHTATPTPNCYVPRLRDFNQYSDPYFRAQAGAPVSFMGYARFADVPVKWALYDAAGSLVGSSIVVSTADGYLLINYTVQGTEDFSGAWRAQIMDPSVTPPSTYSAGTPHYDETILYIAYPVPTPVPTSPCMNMVTSAADTNYFVPESTFIRDGCQTQYVRVSFTTGTNTLAWYDADGNLVATDTQSGTVQIFSYDFAYTGAIGTWHITLYPDPAVPAMTWPGNSGGLTCGPTAFTVQ